MRPGRALRMTGAVVLAGLSWSAADRLTSSALGHHHVLTPGGSAVGHVHASALLLAGASVLLACLAGILAVALLSGSGRATGATAPVHTDPFAADGGPGAGRAAVTGAWRVGLLLGGLAVMERVAGSGGQGHPVHARALVLAGLVHAAVAAAAQLAWSWCVDLVLARARRSSGAAAGLQCTRSPAPPPDPRPLSGTAPGAHRGRGPPARTVTVPAAVLALCRSLSPARPRALTPA